MNPRKSLIVTAGALLGVYASTLAAQAVELTMSAWVPRQHTFVVDVMEPWAKKITERTDGRITFKLLPQPVASPPAHMDATRDGLVDIALIAPNYYPGKFDMFRLGEMPDQSSSARVRGVAFERMYEKFVLPKIDDTPGVHELGAWSTSAYGIWTVNKPIQTPEDAKGLKIRLAGGIGLTIGEVLSLTPIVKPGNEVYEMLSSGIADGVHFPSDAVCAYKLYDFVTDVAMLPGGLNTAYLMLIMNEDRYNSLAPEDRAVIDELSGEMIAQIGGAAADAKDAGCWKDISAHGVKRNELSDDFKTYLVDKLQPVVSTWKENATAAGIDADAAYKYYFEQIKELEDQ